MNLTANDLQNGVLLSSSKYSIMVWCSSILLVFTAPFNIVITYLLSQQKKTINTCGFTTFAISLAVTDCLVGLVSLPITIVQSVNQHWPLDRMSCFFFLTIDYGLTTVSALLVAAMGYDRYKCVSSPLSYRVNFQQRRLIVSSVLIWLFGIGAWVPGLTVSYFNRYSGRLTDLCAAESMGYLAIPYTLIMYYLPLVFIIIIYVKLVLNLRRRLVLNSVNDGRTAASYTIRDKQQTVYQLSAGFQNILKVVFELGQFRMSQHHPGRTSNGNTPLGINSEQPNNINEAHDVSRTSAKHINFRFDAQNLRCLKTSMLVVVCFVLSWGPVSLVWPIVQICEDCIDVDISRAINILCYFNSTVNPFIYLATSAQLRKDFKKFILRK